jgi:rhomboid family GlyGly-CTERM serine protease
MTHTVSIRDDQGGVRPPWSSFLLILAMVVIHAVFRPMAEGLVFDRAAIAQGQVWRLVTGHMVHGDPVHLIANVGALFILGVLLETVLRLGVKTFWTTVGLSIAAIDLALWFWVPSLEIYCGFSGVLNAFFIVVVYGLWKETGDSLLRWIAVAGLGKIAVETWGGFAILPLSGLPSVTEAHFAGFAAGLFLCVLRDISASSKGAAPLDWRHATVSRHDAAHP